MGAPRDLAKLTQRAAIEAPEYSLRDLESMVRSVDPELRLMALLVMREQIEAGQPSEIYLDMARTLIPDEDNDCRWQALIVVGYGVETNPEAIWNVICEFGLSEDPDMRVGVATILLEHLLEHHFEAYWPRLKTRLEAGAMLLVDTLRYCYAFGQAESRWSEVQELLDSLN